MKNKDMDVRPSSTNRLGITIDDSIKSHTEENSPFIKRKMDQVRAVLSKSPLPDFKNMSVRQPVKK